MSTTFILRAITLPSDQSSPLSFVHGLTLKTKPNCRTSLACTSPGTEPRAPLASTTISRELFEKHDMVDCKPSCLPMDHGFLATISKHTYVPLTGTDLEVYPSMIGSLQYTAVCTRPDISIALSILGSTQDNPTVAHMQALKKVSRYLKGSHNMSLTLRGGGTDNSLLLTSFVAADWGNDCETRRSRLGFFYTGKGCSPL
jgi:hypothetical protein